MSEITATGFREIDARLAALGSVKGTRVIRRALLVAAAPIVEQAKHNVATSVGHSGALAKSINRRFVISAKGGLSSFLPSLGGRFAAQIAPFKSDRVATALYNLVYRRKRKGVFHGHFIEFGHRIGTSTTGTLTRSKRGGRFAKRAQGVGHVAARPFLAPALRARAQDAVNIFRAEVKDGIERELKRK